MKPVKLLSDGKKEPGILIDMVSMNQGTVPWLYLNQILIQTDEQNNQAFYI